MHFLCLHGFGTSSQVLEMQTATLRYELGGNHTFDFAEGSVPAEGDPEIKHLFPAEDQYFGYHAAESAASVLSALSDLQTYIATEGPFDGIIAFSNGAALAATMLIRHQKESCHQLKCAVFFSGGIPFDEKALLDGKVLCVEASRTERVQIPTAHVWGSNDQKWAWTSVMLCDVCDEKLREVYIHTGGHEIPGSRSKEEVTKAVQAIRRTIDRVRRVNVAETADRV